MKLRYTPAAVFLSLIPCVSIAQDAEVLQSAILKGCGLDELEKLIQGGVSVHTEIALFPGQEPAPLICVLLSEEYQLSDQVPHICSHEDMALFLIRMGADVNAKDKQGRTPLHLCGLDVVFHILVEAGADINAVDNAGNKPQIRARMEGAPLEDDDRSPEEIREEGVCYAEGKKGYPKDEQKAIELYLQAATMGDSTAQRWMGWRYRQGRGVKKNEQQANFWFSKAAQQGDEAAYNAMKHLTPTTLTNRTIVFTIEEATLIQPQLVVEHLQSGDAITIQWGNAHRDIRTKGNSRTDTQYTALSKNTADITEDYTQNGQVQYTKHFELHFLTPTSGTFRAKVTDIADVIGAKAIIYIGDFVIK